MPKYRVMLRGLSDTTKEGKKAFLKEFARDAQISPKKAAEIIKESKGALYTFEDIETAEDAKAFLERIGGIATVDELEAPPWNSPPSRRMNRLEKRCGDDPVLIIGGAIHTGGTGFKAAALHLPCKIPRRPRREVGLLLLLGLLIALTINIFFPPNIPIIAIQGVLFLILVVYPFFESFKVTHKTIYLRPEYIAWVACKGPIMTIRFKRGVESVGKLKKIKLYVSSEDRELFFQTFEREYSGFLPKEYRLALVKGEMRQGENWKIINEAYDLEERQRKSTIIWGNALAALKTVALCLAIVVVGYIYITYSRLNIDAERQNSLAAIENEIATTQIELAAARKQPYPSAIVLKGGNRICCEILDEEKDLIRIVSANGQIEVDRGVTVAVIHSARDQEIERLESKIETLEARKEMIE